MSAVRYERLKGLRKPKLGYCIRKLGFHRCKLSFLRRKLGNLLRKFAQVARQSALTDAAIFILSKNDKLKLLTAVRYVWWHKKGVTAHRAAPLTDSPTSIQMAQSQKKALPPSNYRTRT